jgi:D-alanyl-D-alanine carboxypeptidase
VCGVVVVSKRHRVTASYRPALVKVRLPRSGISTVRLNPEAATHLTQLVAAAKKAGYRIVVRSAYRSYATQRSIYRPGMTLTAPAGASEHQTGLAADLGAKKGKRVIRGYGFGRSAAGKWVARHAVQFGFIIRYPRKRQSITKIPYEPWHVRYVGAEVAAGVLATPTKTLEEYLVIR